MLSVSVVVPSYQGRGKLSALMAALSKQETSCDWEVVVVLDGSTDGSAELLEGWVSRLPLRVVNRADNRGRSYTLNEGFRNATKEILVRCDDDLEPAPNYVQRYSELLSAEPRIGVVGLYKNSFPKTAYSAAYGEMVDRRFAAEAYAAPENMHWHYWAGNCAVTREVFNEVGEYDLLYRQYGWEDVDWGYRLHKLGYRVVLDPKLETTHNVAATTTAGRCERARWSGAASVLFNRKHHYTPSPPVPSLWNSLVRICSRIGGRPLGAFIDLVLPALPNKLAVRLVDLSIQASYLRGANEASR